MRYDPRRRIKFPDAEDIVVWRVLDTLEADGIKHEKIPYLPPPDVKSKREHWFPLARVWYTDDKFFLLEYEQDRKLGQGSGSLANKQTEFRIEHRRKVWEEKMKLPILYIRREWANWMVKHTIEDYIKKLREVG